MRVACPLGIRPVSALAILLVAGPTAARTQDPLESESVRDPVSEGDWGLAITPCAFFASQSTDVGGEAIRQSLSDLASITDFGSQAHADCLNRTRPGRSVFAIRQSPANASSTRRVCASTWAPA